MNDFRIAGSFFSCVLNTFSSKFELDFAESLIRCVAFPHTKMSVSSALGGYVCGGSSSVTRLRRAACICWLFMQSNHSGCVISMFASISVSFPSSSHIAFITAAAPCIRHKLSKTKCIAKCTLCGGGYLFKFFFAKSERTTRNTSTARIHPSSYCIIIIIIRTFQFHFMHVSRRALCAWMGMRRQKRKTYAVARQTHSPMIINNNKTHPFSADIPHEAMRDT